MTRIGDIRVVVVPDVVLPGAIDVLLVPSGGPLVNPAKLDRLRDPRHFDLVIDATSLPLATCVEVIIAGARNVEELERIGVCAHRLRRTG